MEQRLIKFNLGCGRKLFKSKEHEKWVNIDIVYPDKMEFIDPRVDGADSSSLPFFILSDLKNMKDKISENTADLIFSSHVIEHIPVYDLEELLLEWKRVLVPGGIMVLEMPDVIKCCINLLQLHTSQDEKMINRMGLYGLYGEQHRDQPYMVHRWGWTFTTLAPVLTNLGFVDVQEEIPLTHMGPVRDFRIKAKKPE